MATKKLLPEKQVAARYGVCTETLRRWDKDPRLDFPRPTRVRQRKYRSEPELDDFDDERQRVPALGDADG